MSSSIEDALPDPQGTGAEQEAVRSTRAPVERIALGVTYRGERYRGWQRQSTEDSIQGCLERALGQFAACEVETICAGRTDAGVHGLNQVVHLDAAVRRDENAWVRGTNRYLPHDIAVAWCRPVPESFHARYSALGRRYTYILRESAVRPALDAGAVGWVFRPLDMLLMKRAAAHFLGEHDFSAMRSSQCQAKSPIRRIHQVSISKHGAYWRFDFDGNAFLHHMVRNIMGCLIAVGEGKRPPEWIPELLASRDRAGAAPTFSPAGLYFAGPYYPTEFEIPEHTPDMDWLPGALR